MLKKPIPNPKDRNRQILEAPALAFILQQITKRPSWFVLDPIEVPADLYAQAYAEMEAILQARGWWPSCELRQDGQPKIERPNFLLQGITVISK